jgi:hypothetical protein
MINDVRIIYFFEGQDNNRTLNNDQHERKIWFVGPVNLTE